MNTELRRIGEENRVEIWADELLLLGNLTIPEEATGVVVFAQGGASSRLNPASRLVAEVLQGYGLATLLFDLLSVEEEVEDLRTGRLGSNVGLLADRLLCATRWLSRHPDATHMAVGYFGARTGAAAALVAAAAQPESVKAVVSSSGRPDLAGSALPRVQAPTLLIVPESDEHLIDMNDQARRDLKIERRLAVIPGATEQYVEAGALHQVARLAGSWFSRYM